MSDLPDGVIWDVTYACPLRCVHCYSESGRRPSRRLSDADMLRVADAIVAMRPQGVAIAGGEPLLVRNIVEVIDRMAGAGLEVALYTSGWAMTGETARRLAETCGRIAVSVDGATPGTHDRIRARKGSFAHAMRALRLLDEISAEHRTRSGRPVSFGIDCVLLQRNFTEMAALCEVVAPRFPELGFIAFGAVVPGGLANRPGFDEHELLTEEQIKLLNDPAHGRRLRTLAPESVTVTSTDNRILQMHPELVAKGAVINALQLEPDGEARAMPMYEGTVGNILHEPAEVLWKRARARWSDPFVVAALSPARTMRQWAEAARRIDYHFGSDAVRARLDRRLLSFGPDST
ncbi:Antilisterial bacteriocin subtilosin biosynthesis protein AlbA [Nonomuraea coxensis DSM 45129]|uniref:Antilisterial bacteriocin subtilosin biosynthesis protein AlbA n=1 Tax=Nonomuraea coxensis DSM 45129 TaxID=1122611 RepID=A0ABX8TUF3_9ACTN|nr:radical SAM protein [Nonomuraea coxensis]QYC37933.1 Antilisterial bacteriocin subtilosin biosynthesis protein AlbA [Nonomuraea coxensis DSM 45129]